MTTVVRKLFRQALPEQPVDVLEEPLLPTDYESLC